MSLHRVKPARKIQRTYGLAIFAVCLFFIISLLSPFLRIHDPALRMWVFDVGQGDAIFLETPNGKQLLIDGGPDQSVLSKLSSVMWPWDRTIDAIIVTHPDADHITGLVSVLARYDIQTIYETGVRGGTPVIAELTEAMDAEHASHRVVRAGNAIEFDGMTIDFLWPTESAIKKEKDRNNTSIVMRIRYGNTVFLLTGDAEESVEEQIAVSAGDVDVLKIGHHGSKTSTGWKLLEITNPEVAIISAGEKNAYGHPHPIVLIRLLGRGVDIWRTDLDGDILVKTNGTTLETAPVFLPF